MERLLIRQENITFYSDGLRLSGTLFAPNDHSGRQSGVVLCQGNVGIRSYSRFDELGAGLAGHGIWALSFDYRGFGESEGIPGRFMPEELVADVRNAVTALITHLGGSAAGIGLFGSGFGAANALVAGAVDRRVSTVVALAPFGDGARWLQNLHPYWQWRALQHRIDVDRVRRVEAGSSELVAMDEVIPPPPKAGEQRRALLAQTTSVSGNRRAITLESAERILEFQPERFVARLKRRPILIMHAAENELIPLAEAEAIYRAATGPKELVVFPGASHHDLFMDPLFHEVGRRTIGWFTSQSRSPAAVVSS